MGKFDQMTGVQTMIDYSHSEVHSGSHYNLSYSVANLGAATTPDDAMTLSWKTPPGDKQLHLAFAAISASGALFKFVEGKGTGGATPTGILTAHNSRRDSSKTSIITDIAGANAGNVSYDATLFTGTGSEELVKEYIGADGRGSSFTSGESRSEQEWILAPDTEYQLSIFLAAASPGTIQMAWYEHTTLRD